ncbi:MAG: STAS domain-containing protein, partial [Clostridiales bacterium]|nr:STAS domain-containing protein [Clostridiales bacterium]
MEITKTQNGASLVIALSGRLDTTTAPTLESELSTALDGITDQVSDFDKGEYLSSAGLRILRATPKKMNKLGKLVVKNAGADIK